MFLSYTGFIHLSKWIGVEYNFSTLSDIEEKRMENTELFFYPNELYWF